MRRLPKQRFYRALLKADMITEKDIPLLERKIKDYERYQKLNMHFTQERGFRWAEKLQAFARWLWEHREAILRILGLVLLFADDGTPTLKDEKELDADTIKRANENLAKRKPTKWTPNGEKVIDFTETTAVEELTKEAQEAGLYDIGVNENPLVNDKPKQVKKTSGAKDEVRPGEDSGKDVAGHEPNDV